MAALAKSHVAALAKSHVAAVIDEVRAVLDTAGSDPADARGFLAYAAAPHTGGTPPGSPNAPGLETDPGSRWRGRGKADNALAGGGCP